MKDIDKILKTKLENYQVTPPGDLLNSIRKEYPRKSFNDIIKQNKYYIIAAVATIIVAGVFFINNNNEKSEVIKENTEQISNNTNNTDQNNNNVNIIENDNIVENNEQVEENTTINNTEESTIEFRQIFGFNDTSVCGQSIEITYNGETEFVMSNDLLLDFNQDKIKITTNTNGTHYIYYNKQIDNTTIKDSAAISFVSVSTPNVSIKNKMLCYGEELTLNMSAHSEMKPVLYNTNIYRFNESTYKISGLNPGENEIQLLFTDRNNCKAIFSETVIMSEEPDYTIISTPAYCSNNNGTINIIPKNMLSPKFIINDNIENNDGRFENLNPGIYYLNIEYASGCFEHYTLLVRDSLSLSPFFTIERDLVDNNKYIARNLTKLDNHVYEQNNDINFIWKVNGIEYEYEDNPEFEFDSQGEYNIELIARLNNNCESTYSETIYVSGNCFRIPNIFTPNGDGVGDFFKIKSDYELKEFNIQIINKLGEVVFESRDINQHWNGKINGNDDASEGLYYYIIRGEDTFGNKIEQKGALQLVRN